MDNSQCFIIPSVHLIEVCFYDERFSWVQGVFPEHLQRADQALP
jgi:hypothetical protein